MEMAQWGGNVVSGLGLSGLSENDALSHDRHIVNGCSKSKSAEIIRCPSCWSLH